MFSKKIIRNISLIITLIAFLSVFFIISNRFLQSRDNYKYYSDFFCMDTIVSVKSEEDISSDVESIFLEYQNVLSRNENSAEVCVLNNKGEISASDRLLSIMESVISLNDEYGSTTDITIGRLTDLWNITSQNPTVPSDDKIEKVLKTVGIENVLINGNKIALKNNTSLDFGAVGKGAVLDECFEYLKDNSCTRAYISTGSSILLYGDEVFEVGITDPNGGGVLASVKTEPCFLSTSGGYERYFEADGKKYCHIFDSSTGYPTETDLTSVTVFCDSGIKSDFLSTMIFIEGTKNIEKHLNAEDYKIFATDKEKNLYISDGLEFEVYNNEYGK